MKTYPKGIVGAPVTPFTPDGRVDLGTFAKQVNFLIERGVHLLAHPMHIGESLNLTGGEQRDLAKCLVDSARGRVPVYVNVSAGGTGLALDLARYCERIGATGVVLLPPYHWKPPKEAHIDHFMTVGGGIGIQVIAYNNAGAVHIEIGHDVLAHLIERLPNFVGLKDASFHMKYFTEACRVSSELSPGFSVFTGVEYLLPSMPLGGSGAFSACAEVAPKFTLRLYEACARGDLASARPMQYKMSKLLNLLMQNYPATIKYAMQVMGRPVGETRKPILPLDAEAKKEVERGLASLGVLEEEPRGW
ncbi:MAG: dihydrodipicolinate synthase family protein [Candidatus Tectomicrobia bacterium]|nr:dihydrodipicolinate synthase family protein [Candidatus Tectomicrobia bacterium]MBI2178904.1 dihydrodipicolinate synthase family protein [Candidatus Tectomicrobia bacterium]MBI3024434.1 dihydrodipicolinate synthase family protein [Candidatus Tectomicrobia bacterium]